MTDNEIWMTGTGSRKASLRGDVLKWDLKEEWVVDEVNNWDHGILQQEARHMKRFQEWMEHSTLRKKEFSHSSIAGMWKS